MKKSTFISIEMSQEDLSSSAFFYLVKSRLSHGWFRDQKQLAKVIGLSRKTVNVHVQKLKKRKLIVKVKGENGGSYYKLATSAEIRTRYNINLRTQQYSITILPTDTLNDVVKLLRIKQIERLASQQKYLTNRAKNQNSPKLARPKKDYLPNGRSSAKRFDGVQQHETLKNKVVFTYSYLGEKLGVSSMTALRTVRFAEERGLLKTSQVNSKLMTLTFNEYNKTKSELTKQYPNHFFKDGVVFIVLGTAYLFSQFNELGVC